jgi:hypothetical protein
MTTTLVRSRGPASSTGVPAQDLAGRQLIVLITVVVAVLVMGVLALAAHGGPGIVPATTGFRDMTEAAFGTLV